MTLEQFWNIITDSRQDFDANRRDGNMGLHAERLEQILSHMRSDQVREFNRIFTQLYFDAYRWDLWAAAYIIGSGCSDDAFMDFRFWLISMGREVYESAMADPESLADIAGRPGVEVCFFEEFGSIASREGIFGLPHPLSTAGFVSPLQAGMPAPPEVCLKLWLGSTSGDLVARLEPGGSRSTLSFRRCFRGLSFLLLSPVLRGEVG